MEPPCCAPTTSRSSYNAANDRAATHPPSASDVDLDLLPIPGGQFTMGTDDPCSYITDGEGPSHQVTLTPYAIGAVTVTNEVFAVFADATGYRTTAEIYGSSFVFAGLLPDEFPPTRAVAGAPWWRDVEGATWRNPEGPHSNIGSRGNHPVVHVSWLDVTAFCRWAQCRLPTEAEWERAARGGLEGAHFPWGHVREPNGEHRMNVFQGDFPASDSGADGWIGTCPVRSFPPNGFGLFETSGNVWEWCSDWYAQDTYARSSSVDPGGPLDGAARVMRGGSYLCHDSYCWRYRVDARSSNTPDSSSGNIGFRVARATPTPADPPVRTQ